MRESLRAVDGSHRRFRGYTPHLRFRGYTPHLMSTRGSGDNSHLNPDLEASGITRIKRGANASPSPIVQIEVGRSIISSTNDN